VSLLLNLVLPLLTWPPPTPRLQGEHIAVCSIEKANGVITTLLQQKRLHELVAVVVDEAHMLADPSRSAQHTGCLAGHRHAAACMTYMMLRLCSCCTRMCVCVQEIRCNSACTYVCRGPALEMLLSKLMYHHGSCNIQVVAMSATMAGLEVLATWLHAALFLTNYRPVPLTEHAVLQGQVFRLSGAPVAGAWVVLKGWVVVVSGEGGVVCL
jgi:DNA polymerase theta